MPLLRSTEFPSPGGAASPHDITSSRGAGYLAAVLTLGAFAIVLAGVNSTVFDLERHTVPKAFVLHMTAMLCLVRLLPGWRTMMPGIVEALLGAFVVWTAISFLFSENHWLALDALAISFSGLVLFLGARRLVRSERARAFTLTGLAAAAVLAALLGIAQAHGVRIEWLAQDRVPGGTFGNRNFLAHFLTIALPPVLMAAVSGQRRFVRMSAIAAILLMTMAIVLTRSRAAWLGVLVALTIMTAAVLLARRGQTSGVRPWRMVPAALAFVVSVALAVFLPNRLAWSTETPYAESLARIADFASGSGKGRIVQWRNSLRLVPENPVLGAGPGNWFVHYPRVTTPGDPSFGAVDPIPTNPWPSSDWVAMIVERGPIGAMLLLLAGLSAAVIAVRRTVTPKLPQYPTYTGDDVTRPNSARAIATLGVLTATFVTGLFDAVLLLPAPVFLVSTTLGLLLPATQPVSSRPLAGRVRRAAVTATLSIAAAVSIITAGRLASLIVARDAPGRDELVLAARLDPGGHRVRLLLSRRGDCIERVRYARAAAGLMPHHEAPRRALRACGVPD